MTDRGAESSAQGQECRHALANSRHHFLEDPEVLGGHANLQRLRFPLSTLCMIMIPYAYREDGDMKPFQGAAGRGGNQELMDSPVVVGLCES